MDLKEQISELQLGISQTKSRVAIVLLSFMGDLADGVLLPADKSKSKAGYPEK